MRSRTFRWLSGGVVVVALIVVSFALHLFSTSKPQSASQVVVKVERIGHFGDILVTPRGFTVYTYQLDTRDHSNCATFCLHLWPAVTVSPGRTPRGVGVSDLGFITRPGGVRQVTFHGRPLYTYVIDGAPGVVLGNTGWWSIVPASGATPPRH